MTAVLDEILNDVTTLEGDAASQFEQLARSIHAGEKPTAAHVIDILRRAGKTKEDLSSRVWKFGRRDALMAKIREYDQRAAGIIDLRRLAEVGKEELEAHVAAHQAACRPLQIEISQNTDFLVQNGQLKQELFSDCDDPSLRSQFNAISSAIHECSQRIDKSRDSHDRAKSAVNSHNYAHFPDERTRIDAWVVRAKQELDDATGEQAELFEQRSAVEQAMRDW